MRSFFCYYTSYIIITMENFAYLSNIVKINSESAYFVKKILDNNYVTDLYSTFFYDDIIFNKQLIDIIIDTRKCIITNNVEINTYLKSKEYVYDTNIHIINDINDIEMYHDCKYFILSKKYNDINDNYETLFTEKLFF